LEVQSPGPVTFDHLDLAIVADGRHSVPTQLRIDAGGESRTVDVPPVTDGADPNATASVPVSFPQLTGNDVRVTITAIRPVTTIEYHENQPIVMPVGIAELGIPGVERARRPRCCHPNAAPTSSRSMARGRHSIDRRHREAQSGEAVDFEPCADPVSLTEGDHHVRSTPGTSTGIDVGSVVLGSDAQRCAHSARARWVAGELHAVGRSRAGRVAGGACGERRPHGEEAQITGAQPGVPFWLVLGESISKGGRQRSRRPRAAPPSSTGTRTGGSSFRAPRAST
jgi:hypothetical protein